MSLGRLPREVTVMSEGGVGRANQKTRTRRAIVDAARELVRPVLRLLAVMALSALLCGMTGYVLTRRGMISPPVWVQGVLPQRSYSAFMADWCAHNASYAAATVGGIVLCVMTYRKRVGAQFQ